MKISALSIAFVALACSTVSAIAQEKSEGSAIFDGKSLKGWSAPDMSWWSVKDGAITAVSSEAKPCKHNQFLVWQDGKLEDFELTLKFRIEGGKSANAGIQVRSMVEDDGHVMGYQCDIAHPDAPYLGCIYDEKSPRKLLAGRGMKTTIAADGSHTEEKIEGAEKALADYKQGEWADYKIKFIGNVLEIGINGVTTAIVIDQEEAEAEKSGILALQLHSGPAMTIQYKDLVLKKL